MAKRKASVESAVRHYFSVVADADRYESREGDDSGEPYSYRGETTTSWSFEYLNYSNKWGDIEVTYEPVIGRTYYVLLAIYSTGDSFGQDHARNVEYFDAYESSEAAYAAERELRNRERPKNNKEMFQISFTNHQGRKVTMHCPWDGYFESLDDIRVEALVLHNPH